MFAYGYIKTNWQQAVDLYTRQCSVGVNAKDLAMMAATLADGGKNPVTGKQVIDAAKVPGVLAVMATAGLYDDSGKWLYHTGLPGEERRRRRHHRRLARQVRHRRRLAAARRCRQQRARAAGDRRHLERARRQSLRRQKIVSVTGGGRAGAVPRRPMPRRLVLRDGDEHVAVCMDQPCVVAVAAHAREGTAYAQKTDIVRLANGDRITGEVQERQRGTARVLDRRCRDDLLRVGQGHLARGRRQFDVTTTDGRHYFGSLAAAPRARHRSRSDRPGVAADNRRHPDRADRREFLERSWTARSISASATPDRVTSRSSTSTRTPLYRSAGVRGAGHRVGHAHEERR